MWLLSIDPGSSFLLAILFLPLCVCRCSKFNVTAVNSAARVLWSAEEQTLQLRHRFSNFGVFVLSVYDSQP